MKRAAVWLLVLAAAAGAGFGIGALTFKPPAPQLEGAALSQTPAASPSKGPASRILPDLVGLRRPAAEKRLDSLDLLYLIQPVNGGNNDAVTKQFPAAGTPLRETTHVLLDVQCNPRPCPQPPEGKQLYDSCGCHFR